MSSTSRKADITPIRVPRDAAGVVVFGGTFDPPHRWHVKVASVVRRRLFGAKGWVVFVPAARSPLKAGGPVASPGDRVRMLRLATRRMASVRVWTDEIDRAERGHGGPSYTVDTLMRLRRVVHERVPLRLLIGSDQAAQFHRWRQPDDIVMLAIPAVVWRPPIAGPRALRRALPPTARDERERLGVWLELIVPAPVDPMCSTEVRELLARMHRTGHAPAVLRRMLDPGVLAYIRRRGLYVRGVGLSGLPASGPRPCRSFPM